MPAATREIWSSRRVLCSSCGLRALRYISSDRGQSSGRFPCSGIIGGSNPTSTPAITFRVGSDTGSAWEPGCTSVANGSGDVYSVLAVSTHSIGGKQHGKGNDAFPSLTMSAEIEMASKGRRIAQKSNEAEGRVIERLYSQHAGRQLGTCVSDIGCQSVSFCLWDSK